MYVLFFEFTSGYDSLTIPEVIEIDQGLIE